MRRQFILTEHEMDEAEANLPTLILKAPAPEFENAST